MMWPSFVWKATLNPFTIIPVLAKMPLGALALTLPQVEGKKAGRVEVSDNGTIARTFYHVEIQGSQLKYDNPIIVEQSE
jgi:hypothetical protein